MWLFPECFLKRNIFQKIIKELIKELRTCVRVWSSVSEQEGLRPPLLHHTDADAADAAAGDDDDDDGDRKSVV